MHVKWPIQRDKLDERRYDDNRKGLAMSVINPRQQLELVGLEQALLAAELEGATPSERRKLRDRLEVVHQLLIDLPSPDDIAFLHSGLCQTYLPHSRPKENHAVWRRELGRFTLIVTPGVLDERPRESTGA